MSLADVQRALNRHGFPCGAEDNSMGPATASAIMHFQQAYNGPPKWLAIDGKFGPETEAAAKWMDDNNSLVTHFSVDEIKCKHCGLAYVKRELLSAMFALREAHGPVTVLDAYRCPAHNASVGGAPNSQHVLGLAFDPSGIKISDVLPLKVFSGIGTPDHVRATHLDVRTNASTVNPSVFYDASVG